VSGRPGVAYPNRGEGWDAVRRVWVGPGSFAPGGVVAWRDAGARLVGGCCRVTPADIAEIATALRST
jgi:homocysteine S-methyltransferase